MARRKGGRAGGKVWCSMLVLRFYFVGHRGHWMIYSTGVVRLLANSQGAMGQLQFHQSLETLNLLLRSCQKSANDLKTRFQCQNQESQEGNLQQPENSSCNFASALPGPTVLPVDVKCLLQKEMKLSWFKGRRTRITEANNSKVYNEELLLIMI